MLGAKIRISEYQDNENQDIAIHSKHLNHYEKEWKWDKCKDNIPSP